MFGVHKNKARKMIKLQHKARGMLKLLHCDGTSRALLRRKSTFPQSYVTGVEQA